jgi:hypothetical protein
MAGGFQEEEEDEEPYDDDDEDGVGGDAGAGIQFPNGGGFAPSLEDKCNL